jgi:hypothetical protein
VTLLIRIAEGTRAVAGSAGFILRALVLIWVSWLAGCMQNYNRAQLFTCGRV